MLDQILSRETNLPIKVVKDGMITEENHIYIIPSGYLVSIYHGRIYLIPKRNSVIKLPIDHFFESLAIDQGEKVIGIIMSGTGKDGSLGMQLIKKNGGTLIVQSEESAQFYDMPLNTLKTSSVDYILTPEDMPSKILELIKNKKNNHKESHFVSHQHFSVDLMKICHIIRLFSGIDFSHYKEEMIDRRVKIRMSLLNIRNVDNYIYLLNNNLEEREKLFKSLTLGSKKFFQDQDICDVIKKKVLPIINYKKKYIRIWSVGCSTGQEVYSLAIIFLEHLEKNNVHGKLKFFATDIDESVLNSAREGVYKKDTLHQIDEKLLKKYFEPLENGYRVLKEVREMIVFAKHDLLKDPPFSKLDLINCRNVLMNYNEQAQYNILYAFHYALDDDGFLIIGRKESLGKMSNAFTLIHNRFKIFSYKDSKVPKTHRHLTAIKNYVQYSNNSNQNLILEENEPLIRAELIQKFLEVFVAAGILIDSNYKILQIFKDVHPYLKISKGKFSDNIFANISSDLALIITNSLKKLENEALQVIKHEVTQMSGYEDFLLRIDQMYFKETKFFLISFESLKKASENSNTIITDFSEIDFNTILEERIFFLEKELLGAKKNRVAKEKELENNLLKLKQSNDALVISNERLQSINEELYSINDEYDHALKEQFQTTGHLKTLISNLPVEGIYLNQDLNIISMSDGVSKYTNLLEEDVGRSIEHLVVNKHYPSINEDIKKVIQKSKVRDRLIEEENNSLMFRIKEYSIEHKKGIIILIIIINELFENIDQEGSLYEGQKS